MATASKYWIPAFAGMTFFLGVKFEMLNLISDKQITTPAKKVGMKPVEKFKVFSLTDEFEERMHTFDCRPCTKFRGCS